VAGDLMALRPINGERRSAAVIAERAAVKQARQDTKAEIDGINVNLDALTASMAALQLLIDAWDAGSNAVKFAAAKDGLRELKAADKIAKDIARTVKSLVKATLE
jgi:L-rhamnose isomerase